MLTAIKARKLAWAGRQTTRMPLTMLKSLRPLFRRPGKYPLHKFRPKVAVYQTSESFVLKTAANPFELRQALQLRHEINGVRRRERRSIRRPVDIVVVPERVLVVVGVADVLGSRPTVDLVARAIVFLGLDIVGPRCRMNKCVKLGRFHVAYTVHFA